MDPVTLILTALVGGAAAGGKAVATNAIKDAYSGLKTLIQRRFAGKPSAELALTEHENDPTTWEAPLKKALVDAQIDQDEDIIGAAQKVMTLIQPQQAGMGKYNVQSGPVCQDRRKGSCKSYSPPFPFFVLLVLR
jgi:hypothetical protein